MFPGPCIPLDTHPKILYGQICTRQVIWLEDIRTAKPYKMTASEPGRHQSPSHSTSLHLTLRSAQHSNSQVTWFSLNSVCSSVFWEVNSFYHFYESIKETKQGQETLAKGPFSFSSHANHMQTQSTHKQTLLKML